LDLHELLRSEELTFEVEKWEWAIIVNQTSSRMRREGLIMRTDPKQLPRNESMSPLESG